MVDYYLPEQLLVEGGKGGDNGLWKSLLIASPKYLKKGKKGRRIEK
jgi:hypothetical protein